jgi:hypothetical protein
MGQNRPNCLIRQLPRRSAPGWPEAAALKYRTMFWPATRYAGPLTVCAIDLGAGDGLAAFSEHYPAPGKPPTHNTSRAYTPHGVRAQLAGDLIAALKRGTVALGLEGPCWGEADGPLGPLRPRWFEKGTPSSWYGRSGGPAALKAAVLLAGLLAHIGAHVSRVTYGISPRVGASGVLLLWEAFVAGEAKTVADFPEDECWDVATGTCRQRAPATRAVTGAARDDVCDAFRAVRYGYANMPQRNPLALAGPHLIGIIDPVIAATRLPRDRPGRRVPVIMPALPTGTRLWP